MKKITKSLSRKKKKKNAKKIFFLVVAQNTIKKLLSEILQYEQLNLNSKKFVFL